MAAPRAGTGDTHSGLAASMARTIPLMPPSTVASTGQDRESIEHGIGRSIAIRCNAQPNVRQAANPT
jgi:hypothetical protein